MEFTGLLTGGVTDTDEDYRLLQSRGLMFAAGSRMS